MFTNSGDFDFIYKPKFRNFTGKFSKLKEHSDENGFVTSYEIICEKTFGHTIGNAMRRSLLSNLSGYAPIAVHLNSAKHIFDTVRGIKETMIEIVMRIKKIVIYTESKIDDIFVLSIHKANNRKIFSKDLEIPTNLNISVINKNLHLCTLDADTLLDLDIIFSKGYGYVESNQHEFSPNLSGNFFAIDSIFSPVLNCTYNVETHTGGKEVFDRIILDLHTNGSVSTDDIIGEAVINIHNNLNIFKTKCEVHTNEEDWDKENNLDLTIDEHIEDTVELSTRTRNRLINNHIETVADLANNTEASLRVMPGLGEVAVSEIIKFLLERGLFLGKKINRKTIK